MTYKTTSQQSLIADIYQQYANDVKLYFLKYTREAGMADPMLMAEDMTQDLFVKLMGYEDMIISDTAKSFVFTIARRMIVDDARHQQFVRRAVEGMKYEQDHFWQESETLECKQLKEMEIKKLRTLPKKMAQVYELTRFQEKTAQEIADEMHISKRTVEYHLLMSRREIRQSLRMAVNM